MTPFWKLKREAQRLGRQLRQIPESVTDPMAQRRLDRLVAEGLPLREGGVPMRGKVVLHMIHQPNRISDSTVRLCGWLAERAYAPLVVSNAPVSEADQARLSPVIWRVVERPNFGYDFGGYRDGLTCLRQWGIDPESLILLNDSAFLPLQSDSDLLDRLALHEADIAGAIMGRRKGAAYLESHLLRLRGPVLTHPAHLAFWDNLRLSSNKLTVVERGERGFSAAMRTAGITLGAVYSAHDLDTQLCDKPDEMLRQTLRYAAYIDADLAATGHALQDGSGARWRMAVIAHIHDTLTRREGYSSFPYAMVTLQNYPLLKKSAAPYDVAWRKAWLAAVDDGGLPAPCANLLDEIRSR